MRRPEIHRAVAITLGIAGIASIVASHAGPGALLLAVSLAYGVSAHMQAARLRRLRAGEGLLGRWRVGGEGWRAFNAEFGGRSRERPDGVEVLVGEDSTVVDGDIRPMPLTGGARVVAAWFVDGAVPHLQFDMRVLSKREPVYRYHRVPVAPDARDSAQRAADTYMARIAAVKEGAPSPAPARRPRTGLAPGESIPPPARRPRDLTSSDE